ncbi:MAG: hypothetical protein FMNOHCHN_02905 [Ignavibacteriaceae bacterium]|nr:hypothetical protein [Ignavibacteriaceae bacterium]
MYKVLLLSISMVFILSAQQFEAYFDEASQRYQIPVNILKAVAFSETRGVHIINDEESHQSCIGLPHVYGIMGLRNDHWFGKSVDKASEITGFTPDQITSDERINILAAAALLDFYAAERGINRNNINNWKEVIESYSGIRQDAVKPLYSYEIFRVMKEGYISENLSIPVNQEIDLGIFPEYVKPGNDPVYIESEDYGPAVWDPSPNYTNGNISHQFSVVHTTQGGFAGSVSWLKNPAANASTHYIIRSSDGYIVQLVREQNRAWHVVCWNGYSLGVEHEGFVDNPAWYTDEMYIASANLFNHFSVRYNIPFNFNRIIGHNQWQNNAWRIWMQSNYPGIDPTCNTHTDPGIYWDWPFYMQLVSKDTTSPVITGYSPSVTGDSIWANQSIKITFSQRMKKSAAQSAFTITPQVSGVFSWENSGRTLVFKPTGLYQLGQLYQVSFDTSAVNYNNRKLLSGIEFSFVTRSTAPLNVLNTYPAVNQQGISNTVKLKVEFDTPLLTSSITGNIGLFNFSGEPVQIKNVVYSEVDGKGTVTFSPQSSLKFSSDYSIQVSSEIKNILGTSLGTSQIVQFRTADSIYVAGTLIDNFELIKNWKDPNFSGSTIGTDPNATTFTISNEEKYAGSASGKINYVFTGAGGVCRTFNADKPSIGSNSAETFGLWIYGDLSYNYLEYWFYYSASSNVIVKADTLNWTGWKWVEVPVSSITGSGDKLFHSIVIKQSPTGATSGAVYVDNAIRRNPALTDAEEHSLSSVPAEYILNQNFPNPFNPETIIRFSLPENTVVELSVYDILGKKVATLADNVYYDKGNYSLRFSISDHGLSSGIYFYRLKTDRFTAYKKMTIIK